MDEKPGKFFKFFPFLARSLIAKGRVLGLGGYFGCGDELWVVVFCPRSSCRQTHDSLDTRRGHTRLAFVCG